MPPIVFIQTDIYSLVSLALGTCVFGVVVTWYLMKRRQPRLPVFQPESQGDMYLLFSRISHRLKTVGEVIRGHLHGFSDDLPQDAERWRVARRAITDEASQLDTLVNRLDLVVRLGMAEHPLVFEPVNVPRLLEDLMVDLGPAADAKGMVLGGVVSSVWSNGSQVISADPLALREVFSALLENAVKHNQPGTEISAEVKEKNGRLQVNIADNGKGMPPDLMSTIFEKGSRSYRPGIARGTGMGLYLCKMLVESHGGEISVSSQNGSGTAFQVSLPLRRVE
jgi:two-component system sensor histidine kinase ResE